MQTSSGVAAGGAESLATFVTSCMAAVGAAAGVAASGAAAVLSGGAATPVMFYLPALTALSASVITAAMSHGAIWAVTEIGHRLPDNLYITVDGTKVFPKDESWYDIYSGDMLKSSFAVDTTPETTLWQKDKFVRVVQKSLIYGAQSSAKSAMIELWEHDVVLANDRLGFCQIALTASQNEQFFVMANEKTDSMYVMGVTVHD